LFAIFQKLLNLKIWAQHESASRHEWSSIRMRHLNFITGILNKTILTQKRKRQIKVNITNRDLRMAGLEHLIHESPNVNPRQ